MDLQPSKQQQQQQHQPLSELSPNTNTTSPTKSQSTFTASTTHNSRPEVFKDENKNTNVERDGAKQTYISPSDTIMSPTTKKLSQIKGRRFAAAKPQSLFAKTVGKQQAFKSADAAGDATVDTGRGGLAER